MTAKTMNISRFIKIILLTLIFSACASEPEKPEANPLGLRYEHVVPLEIGSDYNNTRVFVQGTADGQDVRFMLDTGSYISAVRTSSFFNKYPEASSSNLLGLYSSKTQSFINVKSLVVGKESLGAHRVWLTSDSDRHEGVIGMDALKDRLLLKARQRCRSWLSCEEGK